MAHHGQWMSRGPGQRVDERSHAVRCVVWVDGGTVSLLGLLLAEGVERSACADFMITTWVSSTICR